MKKVSISFLLIIAGMTAVAQDKIIFKGSTDTAYNGSTIVIYNKPVGLVDSAKVVNGGFTFSVPYKGPSRYMFYSKYEAKKKGGYYSPYGIMVTAASTVTIKADMETLANSIIGNAPENVLYTEYAQGSNVARQKVTDQLKNKYGADVIENLKPKDPQYPEIMKLYTELNTANKDIETARLANFIKTHPNSFAAVYILGSMSSSLQPQRVQELYDMLGIKYKNTTNAVNILKAIEAAKITAIGKIAPDFEQPDTAGRIVKLSDFKGRYVLLDFWASWCGPCRAENPNVVKAYQKYHDKGFTVLGISLDQPGKKEAWLNAIHHDQLNWTQISDLQFWDNKVAKLYGIQSIPQNYLLDESGKIIASNIRGEELDKKLAEIFINK